MQFLPILTFVLVTLLGGVTAQNGNCGTGNSDGNCAVGAYPQSGTTIYWAPSDCLDVDFYSQAEGSCSPGTSGDVSLYSGQYPGTFIADCGCLPLDGTIYNINCNGITRNSLAAGTYNFQVYLGPNEAVDQFTLVTTQQTSTAPTPTSTVTSSSTETDTTTTTTTTTFTSTSAQTIVTSPAASSTNTYTVTPSPITTTTTQTTTYTKSITRYTETCVTVKSTAHCTKLHTCPYWKPKPTPRYAPRDSTPLQHLSFGSPALDRRQCSGDPTPTGDGPLTSTVTPSPVYTTTTVNGGTTTETDTSVSSTTTTVPATPATTTVYSGTSTIDTTTTIPAQTITITIYTSTHVKSTTTSTITETRTVHTTPVCTKTK